MEAVLIVMLGYAMSMFPDALSYALYDCLDHFTFKHDPKEFTDWVYRS